MIKKWTVRYPAYTGTERRNAYVYLPDGYQKNRRRHYPVLYMFDGHNVFYDSDATYGKSWGMAEFLDKHKIPLIVAAVECNHSPEGGRLSEYSPFDFNIPEFGGEFIGRGRETMEGYINVFKPMIDKRYRTLPDRKHTFISGSSMGGLMTLYAVFKYNHVFSRGASLSPSMEIDMNALSRMIRKTPVEEGTVLYVDYGEGEFAYDLDAVAHFEKLNRLLVDRHVLLPSRIIPNGTHCEASWEKQLPFAINTLMYDLD